MAGLPSIDPYPMPLPGEFPPAAVGWRVDPRRAVLLVHDMQEYFLRPFPRGTSPRDPLVSNATLLRRRCAELGVPVAYTAQPGGMTPAERGLLADFWGPGMRTSPEHRRVVAGLEPAPDDWVFTKWRYSAFFNSGLLERMRTEGRDQLVICGVYAHVGVLMTAVDAFTRDIQPFLVGDAVADFSAPYHRLALEYAAERCAAVLTTASVCEALAGAVPAGDRR
ncbi:isochorismatase family protein [Streptomyces sp. NBC_00347]|uniref:isochorismatase family protein n=1 Tax=Streptomyces sp. NBC_00347 TaxID=2975721 RepID=UPI0022542855|nr:isochorismatase family protein [Streptomyces sp. NBC_00347]MCX5127847.1 isochorismatase family protein [Streptomyces sp. NBC_00347]